jgi:hypothetical protein
MTKKGQKGKKWKSGTGTAYTSGAPEFTPDFCGFVLLNLEFSV